MPIPRRLTEEAIRTRLSGLACGPWEAEQVGQTFKHLSQLLGSPVESEGGVSSTELSRGPGWRQSPRGQGELSGQKKWGSRKPP